MFSYHHFIAGLSNQIDRVTQHFVFDGYQALAHYLSAPLGSLIILYIVLMGYAMVRGLIQSPQQELFKFTIRAGLIYLTAMNWGFFSEKICDLFIVGSESIATTLMQAVHHQASSTSINEGLQKVFDEVLGLGSSLFEAGSFRKLSPYFAGMMVFLSGSLTIGLALIEILIAKLMLALTLCTAPLFISFCLFEQTKSFFERWLGILVGFSFVLIFVSAVIGLCIHLLHWVLITVTGPEVLKTAIWVPIFIVSALCVMSLSQAAQLGKSIGGALCISGGTAMVGSFLAQQAKAVNFSKTAGLGSWQVAQQSFRHLNQGKEAVFNSGARMKAIYQTLRGKA